MTSKGRNERARSLRRAEYELWLTRYMREHPVINPVEIVEAAHAAGWAASNRRRRQAAIEHARAREVELAGASQP